LTVSDLFGAGHRPSLFIGAPRLKSALLDADRQLGALPDRCLHRWPQPVLGMLLEHVEKVVVTHVEHLGRDGHANGIAIALVEVDHHLPSHRSLPSLASHSAPSRLPGREHPWRLQSAQMTGSL